MDHMDIIEEKIDVDKITKSVTSPSCGAITIFIGTTRDNCDGKKVVRLEYEAYRPMAMKKMSEICQQIRDKWKVEHITMVHRIGLVPVTEASIVIAISSAHRRESLEAIQYAIDTLKATVPIWKKEIYEDDTCCWKENRECCWKAHT
ncbi:hypothetical protein CHS0354_013030 [Potamilus streckersoni]|uniref:Molybdopterin synthase catalytic subunit n=1 Tax=Potamilus streckersoni TaxID=2493646 RepID=A0AAE0SYD8_9BIVA|nr:hypothetical protein CHS0354_013030 [Potamilus streckersoni]